MMRRHLDAALSFVISVLMVVSMVPTPALSVVAEGTSGGEAAASSGDVSSESVKGEETSPAGSGDGAGNVSFDMDASLVGTPSEVTSEAVPEASPEKVRVRFSGGYDGCDDAAMSEFETVLDGVERALPACAFEREGFAFSGWSTTVDGRDVADDPVTEGVDESMRAISVPDSQALVDLRFLDADGHEVDLGQCVRGGMLSLYAQWRALPRVTLAFDANGGTGDMADVEAIANGNVWVLPACSLSRDGFSFVGWSVDGTDLTFADGAELVDGDVTALAERAKDGRVTLRAVWEAKASGDTISSGDKGDAAMTGDSASGDAKSGNVSVEADVDGSVEVTVDARSGSGAKAGAVSEKAADEGAGSEAAKAPDASGTVSSEAGPGKPEGEAAGDAAAGGAEGVSYAHRLIVRPKAGVGARAEDEVLGRSGDVLLLGFATKADMDAARTWYEPRCDLVAEDIALGASEGEGDVAQVSMDGNDNPFKALGEAEEAPALSRLGVTVALLDTGAPSGVTSAASMVSDDGADRNGHASMMFEAMRGQNEHVRVMGVKVLDDAGHGTASSVYAGVMYAVDNGADVINMSFAGPDTEGNAAIAEAVRYALDHDVIVVAAAGNGGYDAGLVTPANVEGVFTVGAVEGGKVRDGSNRGECVDVYVEATSTSVAAAKVSGQVSLGLDGWRERVSEMSVSVSEPVAGSVNVSDGDGVDVAADTTVWWGLSGDTLYLSASSGTNHTNSKAISEITSYDSVPWYSPRAKILTVVIDGSFAPMSTAYWFYDCFNLKTFTNWSNLDVSNVTDMSHMFVNCHGAAFDPDVSSWDTSSVTDMNHMFSGCYGAAFDPDVSNWDTSSVTNMSNMFYKCYGSAFDPDVSNWDTSSVTNMSNMFYQCHGAAFDPDGSNWDTSSVTNMSYMFYDCFGAAFDPGVSNWDTSSVTNMYNMFYNCRGASFNPDVSNWNTSSVTNMRYMFFGCCGASFNPDVSDWNTSSVTDMGNMFGGCYGAPFNPDVSDWNTSSVTDMGRMFYYCCGASFNPDVSNWNTSSVTNMNSMFSNCYGASFNPDVSSLDTSNVTNMSSMFNNCYGVAFTGLDVSGWNFTKVTSTANYLGLQNCNNLKELKVSASSRIAEVPEHTAQGAYLSTWGNADCNVTGSTAADMVTTINAGNGAGTWEWELNADDYALLDADGTLTFLKAEKGLTPGTGVTVTDVDGTTLTGQLYAVDLDGYSSGSQVPWYAQRTSIKAVRFAQVMKPVSTAYWFSGCSNLADFDSTNLDTVYVTDMSSMFEFCYNDVFNPDVSVWDTSNVTNMRCMFYYCAGAAFNPDVSSWDTSQVTNMGSMFYGCASAVFNPNMSAWDTSGVINMEGMFASCSGTSFNPDVSNWDTSNVRNMSYTFDECYGAVFNPDVSNWDTSNVTSMSYMFQMCYGTAFNPDVSNWDTSSVTNMNRMFYRCSGAAFTELDVSDWDFSKVTSTSNYLGLQNCTNLRKLTVSAGSKINTMFPEHEAQGLYASTWGNTDRSITGSTAADMVTTINAGNGAGIWEWELNPLAGTAYAVLDSNGLLTFFRSTNTYIAGAGQTVTDIVGNSYTGQVYTGFETANPYSSYSSVPWFDQRSSIQSVAIANGQVIKPNGTAYWFYGCSNLASFSNAGNLDASSVTSMSSMFQVCSDDAFNPDVSAWDTSNVTDMEHMFYCCSGDAFNPDVSAWDTSNVTDMQDMFYHCSGDAFNPDVSAWDTSSVTDMYGVFNDCSGAAFNPDVSSWITSGVTSMSYMFSGCSGSGFTELDVSGWDFSNITSTLNYLGLHGCTSLKQLTVSAGTKIYTNFPEHSAQGDYAATWKNDSQSITRSTAADMVTTINAGNGAGTWEWELAGYTVKLRAPVGLGADDVVETVTATDDWSVPASPFTYARHDFVEWSGSDGETYAPGDVIEANTFSSGDTLILTAVYEPHEYSGVNPQDNPDANGDGYGDNLAISMPASVSCVVKADGSTVWPSNVSVNNLSDVAVRLSSAKVDVCDGFHLVSDIGSAVEANSVSMRFGAGSATLDASSYATKTALPQGASWQAAAGGSVPIAFSVDVSDVSADISQSVPFARVTWWAKVVD